VETTDGSGRKRGTKGYTLHRTFLTVQVGVTRETNSRSQKRRGKRGKSPPPSKVLGKTVAGGGNAGKEKMGRKGLTKERLGPSVLLKGSETE